MSDKRTLNKRIKQILLHNTYEDRNDSVLGDWYYCRLNQLLKCKSVKSCNEDKVGCDICLCDVLLLEPIILYVYE